ncbi:hypothetical protein BA190_08735 [Labrys sp. WJW]|uniref:DUF6925 family protein n=1 Tax=Labrys sp. WJW TaxID=1737983 RepID=UPI0008316E5F|nr:hypothetical protein [Labrys sp. WJW]OCC05487.1 hypothetical protein BA190_08735 [Labrys sp. WJW]
MTQSSRSEPSSIGDWIAVEIADPRTQWSMGTFGAIAEFMRDPDEDARFETAPTYCSITTARGGIRLEISEPFQPVAYETVSQKAGQWRHGIALCLPEAQCAMRRRSVLTDLGPDVEALREQDRDGILFDLGLDLLQVDMAVRTADPDLIAVLRACDGTSLFAPGNPAMAAILRTSPHRVFLTRLGRAEVYQPIPSEGQVSPDGPHTHLLARLLRSGRTHAATQPIPDGLVPCAHLFPASPLVDGLGRDKPFDAVEHARFQNLLERFGVPELLELKQSVTSSIEAGLSPEVLVAPQGRFARPTIRIALRQLLALSGPSTALEHWNALFENNAQDSEEDTEDEQKQHGR